MEAIRKQAAKLREQVARQQQAVLKHLGHVNADAVVVDEEELHCHQKLQDLYSSTKAAKRLQRNIVRGLEGFIATGTKVVEIGMFLFPTSSHIVLLGITFVMVYVHRVEVC
jgi:hypothetical protein